MATRESRENVGHLDREQRQAADLVHRARAVEELEQARDDVDGDAGVAAHAEDLEQLLVVGARERDHHAVHAAGATQLGKRGEVAEAGQPEGELVVVVHVADRDEAELGVVVQAVDQPLGDLARADDQRALEELGGAVDGDAGGGAGQPGGRSRRPSVATIVPRAACGASTTTKQAEQRPRQRQAGQHELRRLADPAGPRAQVVAGVEADRKAASGQSAAHRSASATVSTGVTPATDPPAAPPARAAQQVCDRKLAVQVAGAPARVIDPKCPAPPRRGPTRRQQPLGSTLL